MLYTPHSHGRSNRAAGTDVALTTIREIAADCEASFDSPYWPVHPRDDDGTGPYTTLYEGPSGVIYALDLLARRGLVDTTRDYVPALEQLVEVYRAKPEIEEWNHPPSLLGGETGSCSRCTSWRRLPRLRNGSPSSSRRTSTIRTASSCGAARHDARRVRSTGLTCGAERRPSPRRREDSGLWTRTSTEDRSSTWVRRTGLRAVSWRLRTSRVRSWTVAQATPSDAAQSRRTGLQTGPRSPARDLVTRQKDIRMQWCHGAPGMVASLAEIAPADDEHERLLLAGGELAWRAGPLTKGANLCHGTAGDGLAFLKLFRRTATSCGSDALERCDACRCWVDRERRALGPQPLAVDGTPAARSISRLPEGQHDPARP